jgi:deoxycytidylate deaminase
MPQARQIARISNAVTRGLTRARDAVDERLSQELVIAMMGPIGSGASKTATIINEVVHHRFGYDTRDIIKLSHLIDEDSHKVERVKSVGLPAHERIKHLQETGNALRREYGNDYLAKKAIGIIAQFRATDGFEQLEEGKPPRPIRCRRVWIIDSLKNDEELALLRSVYKDLLLVFGVFAPSHIREGRLKRNGVAEDEVTQIVNRDQGEVLSYGQKTRTIFSDADFFIRNDQDNDSDLRKLVERYLNITFNIGMHTPTRAESAMNEAAGVSNRSSCMSRQVGAAIVDASGDLISVGWNDVPKFNGGLYVEDDQWSINRETGRPADLDHRCFRWGEKICHNDYQKQEIRTDLIKRLRSLSLLQDDCEDADVVAAFNDSRIANLIEFSRSIHAEMEAILAIARDSRHSLAEASLYCTTYPCHNCARHIVAAGIREVVYIQPYVKSLAVTLHHDAITEDDRDRNQRVVFKQYQGVAPKHFARLFRQRGERKMDGHMRTTNPLTADPAFQQPLDSFTAYELRVATELESLGKRAPVAAP